MSDIFDELADAGAARALYVQDGASGLKAIIAIDDLTLGPAAGGIRTMTYASPHAALADAQKLAAAMTLKCAIAGLDAGGAKTVVIDHPGLEREAAFQRLGAFIEDLGGLYRAAGDLGTTAHDLECAARFTRYVNTSGNDLGVATARGLVQSMRACAVARGHPGLAGLKIAMQGAGLIGANTARLLKAEDAEIVVADLDTGRAAALASEIGARRVAADRLLYEEADILSPCAAGGTITRKLLPDVKAWAICGGANNQLAEAGLAVALADADILYVPDFLASAGAVIVGICDSVMQTDPDPLIEGLHRTALAILEEAAMTHSDTVVVAERMARARIDAARRSRFASA